MNSRGEIIYSELENDFQPGTLPDPDQFENGRETAEGYYIFNEISEQGWQIAAVIEKRVYNSILYEWFSKFVIVGVVSLILSSIFAVAIWRMVYKPMKVLNQEIGFISSKIFNSKIRLTNIREFDNVLNQFKHMRFRILELLDEIEKKEKMKRQVEVEKLLHQINPHFLHNTLNTIQWFARLNGQDKIDRLVALLTELLHYNLGKEGGIVTVREEVKALQAYVDLQRLRFDNQLNIEIDIEPETLDLRLPRFILQPLVENAIYHGLKDEQGHISVKIEREHDHLLVMVRDDGDGLDENEIEALLNSNGANKEKVGLGIGLNYVNRMLGVHYGDKTGLHVRSIKGEGTVFYLRIPAGMQ